MRAVTPSRKRIHLSRHTQSKKAANKKPCNPRKTSWKRPPLISSEGASHQGLAPEPRAPEPRVSNKSKLVSLRALRIRILRKQEQSPADVKKKKENANLSQKAILEQHFRAHRERPSQEEYRAIARQISGLDGGKSFDGRAVEIWFSNRRARPATKTKKMTIGEAGHSLQAEESGKECKDNNVSGQERELDWKRDWERFFHYSDDQDSGDADDSGNSSSEASMLVSGKLMSEVDGGKRINGGKRKRDESLSSSEASMVVSGNLMSEAAVGPHRSTNDALQSLRHCLPLKRCPQVPLRNMM